MTFDKPSPAFFDHWYNYRFRSFEAKQKGLKELHERGMIDDTQYAKSLEVISEELIANSIEHPFFYSVRQKLKALAGVAVLVFGIFLQGMQMEVEHLRVFRSGRAHRTVNSRSINKQ
jgi:hypothetical protein